VITTWRYYAPSSPPLLKLKVARPEGGTKYTVVGQSPVQAPFFDQLNTYGGLRIPVQAGDVIGIHLVTEAPCFVGEQSGYTEHIRFSDALPGFMGSFDADLPNSNQLDVSALVEPDCDNDGFGDETQDPSTESCEQPPPDTDPPQTKITKHPANKSKKLNAKFKFSSDEPGATFECKLKGKGLDQEVKQFNDCDSPREYKGLDQGKFKFQVRAVDDGGNVDSSPAKDKFKVVD